MGLILGLRPLLAGKVLQLVAPAAGGWLSAVSVDG